MAHTRPDSADDDVIPFADPSAQFRSDQDGIESAVLAVLRGDRYILGEEVEALESEFAAYIGTTHAVGVGNGTDAITIVLRALGIGRGDEVITVAHTAIATVAAIVAAGATPVVVDVDPEYFTLDPAGLDAAITGRTRAVIPVHLYGQAADMLGVSASCRDRGLAVIEDVSQAHGARSAGQRLGSLGVAGVFSCYPTKNLGAIGDAGLITTDDPTLAGRLCEQRQYGWRDVAVSHSAGTNSRLDEVQAAVLRRKLLRLDESNERRRIIAAHYSDALQDLPLDLPRVRPGDEHVFHLFVVQIADREDFREHLRQCGVATGVHYPVECHKQPGFRDLIDVRGSLVHTEALAARVVSLPMFPELTDAQVDEVIAACRSYFRH